jgi:hypothetical protein
MSGILWIYCAFKTTLEKTRLNHDVSDLQVGALERSLSSLSGILSWMTVQNVFSQSELVFSRVASCLELLDFPVLSFQMFLMWQKSCECHVNVYPFKPGKRPLKPDLDHTPTPLNSRIVIDLQRLLLATESFQTTHCRICYFQLVV